MKRILLIIAALSFSTQLFAKATPKGFHEGPYFLLNGGVFYYAADDNARTGQRISNDYEPQMGFNFGWNIKDYIAPELMVRYSTNKNSHAREHIVDVNINAVLTLITDELTSHQKFRILPFVQAGPMIQFASIPGDPLSGDSLIPLYAPGFGFGGGIKFLFSRYGYCGVLVQADFVDVPEKTQNIGGTETVIIKGQWDIQPAILGMIGVHF